jgi:amidase
VRRRQITARVESILGNDVVICTPTDQVEVEYRNQAMRLLCIAGLCGLPQISLPMATIGGLPPGLSLIGARHSDHALIALARRAMG